MEDTEILRRTLKFRSWHRGTREMDIIMGSFADKNLPVFSHAQLLAYQEFLLENDPDIYDWYTERTIAPKHVNKEILALFTQHKVVTS